MKNLFPQASAPNISGEEDLDCRGERHGKQWTDYPANDQTPGKDRHDHRHRMQPDIISDNSRRVKYAFQVLYKDENTGDDERMRPVAPLKGSDHNRRDPANNYTDVGNHRKDDDHCANHWSKVKAKNRQRRTYEYAIHQTDQQLASKVRRHVTIDFRQHLCDFISEG